MEINETLNYLKYNYSDKIVRDLESNESFYRSFFESLNAMPKNTVGSNAHLLMHAIKALTVLDHSNWSTDLDPLITKIHEVKEGIFNPPKREDHNILIYFLLNIYYYLTSYSRTSQTRSWKTEFLFQSLTPDWPLLPESLKVAMKFDIRVPLQSKQNLIDFFNTIQTIASPTEIYNYIKKQGLEKDSKMFAFAVAHGSLDLIKLFIEGGIDPNTTYVRQSPLYIASFHKRDTVIEYLLEQGSKADTNTYEYVLKEKKTDLMLKFLDNQLLPIGCTFPKVKAYLYTLLPDRKDEMAFLLKDREHVQSLSNDVIEAKMDDPLLYPFCFGILLERKTKDYHVALSNYLIPEEDFQEAPDIDIEALSTDFEEILKTRDEYARPEEPGDVKSYGFYTYSQLLQYVKELIDFSKLKGDCLALPKGNEKIEWHAQFASLLRHITHGLQKIDNVDTRLGYLAILGYSGTICASGRMQQALDIYNGMIGKESTQDRPMEQKVEKTLSKLRQKIIANLAEAIDSNVHTQEALLNTVGIQRGIIGGDFAVDPAYMTKINQQEQLAKFDAKYSPQNIVLHIIKTIKPADEDVIDWFKEHMPEGYDKDAYLGDFVCNIDPYELKIDAAIFLLEELGFLTKISNKNIKSLKKLRDSLASIADYDDIQKAFGKWFSKHQKLGEKIVSLNLPIQTAINRILESDVQMDLEELVDQIQYINDYDEIECTFGMWASLHPKLAAQIIRRRKENMTLKDTAETFLKQLQAC